MANPFEKFQKSVDVFKTKHQAIYEIQQIEDKDYLSLDELKEASEQSRRSTIPLLREPITKDKVKDYMCETNLIGDERKVVEGTSSMVELVNNAKSISVLVGCEGGFTNDEFEYFKSVGFEGVSFGKRILRSETAAIYALSCIMFMLESRK